MGSSKSILNGKLLYNGNTYASQSLHVSFMGGTAKQWSVRKILTAYKKIILHNPLVDSKKVVLSPQHVRLALI